MKLQTVYVDILFVVNCFIDLMLLLCVGRLLHLRTKPVRLLLAALTGGGLSLWALLPPLPALLNLLPDLLGAALLVLVAFGKAPPKRFAVRAAAFFSVSFSFCGLMVFVCTVLRPKGLAVYNDVVYFNISPFVLIILTLICYYMLLLLKRITKGAAGKQICTVTLRCGGKEAVFRALADTGCQVREPFSGEYVIIAERCCLAELPLLNFSKRIIPFESLGGAGCLEGMRAEEILIDGREISNRLYIGVCEDVLQGEVKAIVPYEILKRER